jgi:predicted amidophosphoribosyltransferase
MTMAKTAKYDEQVVEMMMICNKCQVPWPRCNPAECFGVGGGDRICYGCGEFLEEDETTICDDCVRYAKEEEKAKCELKIGSNYPLQKVEG